MRLAVFFSLAALVLLAAPSTALAEPTDGTAPPTRLHLCAELTERGPRQSAIDACREAMQADGSPIALRAMVRALMSGAEQPTADELAQAVMMARAIHRRAPGDLLGYAAECDIAAKMRDLGMLGTCKSELERVAPGHAETVRAGAALRGLRTPWYLWVAWWAIVVSCIAACLHALRRFARERLPRARKSAVLAAAFIAFHALPNQVHAEGASTTDEARKGISKWSIDPTNPEKSVPTPEQRDGNPLEYGYFLMDLAAEGQRAIRLKDYRSAVKYYRAVAKAAPERSIAFTKLCDLYELLGEIDNAIAACRMAVARPGATASDYDDFVRLALSRPGTLHPELALDLGEVVDELRKNKDTRAAAERINCELSARTREIKRLEACVSTLGKGTENDAKAVTYRWILALERENYAEAEALVEQAKKTNMKPDGVEKMRAATLSAQPFFRRWLGSWQRVALALAFLGVALGIAVSVRRTGRRVTATAS